MSYSLMRRCEKCGDEFPAYYEAVSETKQVLNANQIHEDCGGRTQLFRVDQEEA